MSNNNSPIFPMLESQHFSDYGFDPQIHYFQVLDEAKKHKSSSSSIDSFQFKLQKPISKDVLIRTTLRKKTKKRRWFQWKNVFFFLKWKKCPFSTAVGRCTGEDDGDTEFDDNRDVHVARARKFRAASTGSISSPVYVTESWSGSSIPYRTKSSEIPYLSLRELTMERQQKITTSSSSSSLSGPVYLVT